MALSINDKFDFGQYRDEPIKEILKTNPSYILWVQENTKHEFDIELLNEATEREHVIHCERIKAKRYKKSYRSKNVRVSRKDEEYSEHTPYLYL